MAGRFLGTFLWHLLLSSMDTHHAFRAAAIRVESNDEEGADFFFPEQYFEPGLFGEEEQGDHWTTVEDIDEEDSEAMHSEFHAEESCEGDCIQGDVIVEGTAGGGSLLEASLWTPLWPDGIIYYKWNATIARKAKDILVVAMQIWMQKTCIKFVEVTDAQQKDLCSGSEKPPQCFPVHLGSSFKGCHAHLGFQNLPTQRVNLAKGCQKVGTALHELGHAIGLSHEQERRDRDEFIKVSKENVKPEWQQWFFVNPWRDGATRELPYDLSSVMHYSEWSFAKNKDYTNTSSRTITVVQPDSWGNCRIGQRERLSPGDILTVGTLYKCPKLFCIDRSSSCEHLTADMCEGSNAAQIKKLCPKLCGVCQCTDSDKECPKLVSAGNICATQDASRCASTCGLCTPSEAACKDDPYIKAWGPGFSCETYAHMTAEAMNKKNVGDKRPGCSLIPIRKSCPWTCGACPARPYCF